MGRTVEVLVEGPSKSAPRHADLGSPPQLVGRTTCDRIVVFTGNERLVGQIVPVAIRAVSAVTLSGQVVTAEYPALVS